MPINIKNDSQRALWSEGLAVGDQVVPSQELPEVTERVGTSGPYLKVTVPLHPDGVITYKNPDALNATRLEQVALSHLAVVAEIRRRAEVARAEAERKRVHDDLVLLHALVGGVYPRDVPGLRSGPQSREVDSVKRAEFGDAWRRVARLIESGATFATVGGDK